MQLLFGKHSAVATDKTWWHFREKEDKIKLDQNHSIVNDHLLTNPKVVTVEKEAD